MTQFEEILIEQLIKIAANINNIDVDYATSMDVKVEYEDVTHNMIYRMGQSLERIADSLEKIASK
jgi:hypothetical protein